MMNCSKVDLQKVLTLEEIEFYENLRIPYNDTTGMWMKASNIQQKVIDAIKLGLITPIPQEQVEIRNSAYVVSDDLGTHGVVNPVNGKPYDSKYKYYKAVKESGSHIVEPGEHGKKRQQEGDYNVAKELKEAIQQHLR